jgi:hypothetical protein
MWVGVGTTVAFAPPPVYEHLGTRYSFQRWQDGSTGVLAVNVTEPATVRASFGRAFLFVLTTSPPGLTVVVDRTTTLTPVSFWWVEGSSHTVGISSPQAAGDLRHVYVNWSDYGAQQHDVLALSPLTLEARLAVEYLTSLSTVPVGGNITVDGLETSTPASFWWQNGSSHVLNASDQRVGPASRWLFSAWSDGSSSPITAVAGAGPSEYTATFRVEHVVRLGTEPPGQNLTIDGSERRTPATFWWEEGSVHQLLASEPQIVGERRYVFQIWADGGGAVRAFAVAGPENLTAWFVEEFRVLVRTDPPGIPLIMDGEQLPTPATTWWTSPDAHVLSAPLALTLDGNRYEFTGWGGLAFGTDAAVNASGPGTLVAVYALVPSDGPPDSSGWIVVLLLAALIGGTGVWLVAARARRKDDPPEPGDSSDPAASGPRGDSGAGRRDPPNGDSGPPPS